MYSKYRLCSGVSFKNVKFFFLPFPLVLSCSDVVCIFLPKLSFNFIGLSAYVLSRMSEWRRFGIPVRNEAVVGVREHGDNIPCQTALAFPDPETGGRGTRVDLCITESDVGPKLV